MYDASAQGIDDHERMINVHYYYYDALCCRPSLPSSSVAIRRLKSASVTAVKRGILVMTIFLCCYLPITVMLLLFTHHPSVPDIAILLEVLTLPISYVHAVLSPVVVIRVDQQWRHQAAKSLKLCWSRARCR